MVNWEWLIIGIVVGYVTLALSLAFFAGCKRGQDDEVD